MLDTVKNGLMAAVQEALEFMRLRMTLTPYYSEPSNYVGELGYVMPARPLSLRPVQTRSTEKRRKSKLKPQLSFYSDSSVQSSGEEYVPEAVTRRVRKEERANVLVGKALQSFGLEKTEEIVRKVKDRRTETEPDPTISFTQDETEFICVEG